MLTNLELRELSAPSGIRSTANIVMDWLAIIAIFALVIEYPSPIIYVLAFLAMGRQQLALAILMHDAAHRRLYESSQWNDWIGQILLGAPLIFSLQSYKTLHLKHHQNPLGPDDPDMSLIGGYPISKMSFGRKIARDLLGISYFKFIRYFVFLARKSKPRQMEPPGQKMQALESKKKSGGRTFALSSIFIVNTVLFFSLWQAGHPVLYFCLWILPAVTVLQVLLRIRGVAEHAGFRENPNQMLNARTVINRWQTFIFAPHNVNYHVEHHLYPSIPYFRLPEVHRRMQIRGSLPFDNIYPGYGKILTEIIK